MQTISLVIPTYNEAACVHQTALRLRKLLSRLQQQYTVETIFVNDGSQDDTESLLHSEFSTDPTVRVISHAVNQGIGAALRTGFTHATGDIIITTDFSGAYHFSAVPQMIARLMLHNVDIVTASPYHPRGAVKGLSWGRQLVNRGTSLLYRLLVNRNIHTWTALLRVYRRDVVETIPFDNKGALASTELLIRALQAGYTVSEHPATLQASAQRQTRRKLHHKALDHLRYQVSLLRAEVMGRADMPARVTRTNP